MHRTAAVILAAALVAASPTPRAAAKDPLFLLRAKPEKERVPLGGRIKVELTLLSASTKVASCGKLELGSPSGIVFYVKVGGGEAHQVSRLMGTFRGNDFKETAAAREQLRNGGTLTGRAEIVAIQPGKWEVTASYGGVEKALWPDPIEAKPFTVTVDPGQAGETRVGAKLRTSIGNTKGAMVAELYPERAFNTVHNFLSLGTSSFYNGHLFHRILKDFMVQTGDPKANGTGGPGYYIPGEVNGLKFEKGILAMALEGSRNSGGSQFFVLTGKATHLEGTFTAFGRIVEGKETLDALNAVPVQKNMSGEPSDPVEKPRLEGVDLVLLK
jgi:peptidyl-prolyl cis-trans isomerase B (cyclophilin B)